MFDLMVNFGVGILLVGVVKGRKTSGIEGLISNPLLIKPLSICTGILLGYNRPA
jgi:hypothetical protein